MTGRNSAKSVAEIISQYGVILPKGSYRLKTPAHCKTFKIFYSATEELLAYVKAHSNEDVDFAVKSARKAFHSGPWRKLLPEERAKILARVSDLIIQYCDELAVLHTLETGIPIQQAKRMHIPRSAENFRFFGELMNSYSGESYEQMGDFLSIVTREPIGVGLVISPWNAPLILTSMKMAACLAIGNSVIIKPSEYTPLSILRLVELMHEAGVPDDVIHVLNGSGPTLGRELVSHPDIDAIGFIGGTATGKKIMQAAADTLKKVGLELGGKSANIVLASANLDRAVDGSLMAIFANNGEQCLAGSRIIVEDSIADQFIEKFVSRARSLKIGDPFDPETEIGPLAFKGHFNRVLDFAQIGMTSSDYSLLAGGKRADGFERGFFFEPTVLETKTNDCDLCQNEVFGPFVTIQRVKNLEEALDVANNSVFGLVGYIWSDDFPSIMKARRELRTGTVWVNTFMKRDLRAPFGGYKQSGIGRDGIPGSIELFTEEKTTMLPQVESKFPKLGVSS